MTLNTEFTSHWHTFLDTVETRIRKELDKKDRLGIATVNTIVHTELSKWDVAHNHSGAWLQKLGETHPEQAKEFHGLLAKARLRDSIQFEPLPPELRIAAGILFIILFFLGRWLQGASLKEQFRSTGVLAAGLTILYKFGWPHYRQRQADLAVNQLRQEFAKVEQRLRQVINQVDKPEPSPVAE